MRVVLCFFTFAVIFLAQIANAQEDQSNFPLALPKNESIGVVYYKSIGLEKQVSGAGHSALYLSHYCADGPLKVRRCTQADPFWGVVISRYEKFSQDSDSQYDFMVFPAAVHFYGVSSPDDTPLTTTPQITELIRDRYWSEALSQTIPLSSNDVASQKQAPSGQWRDGIGVTLERDAYIFVAGVDGEQSDVIASFINDLDNRPHFEIFFDNCANFVKEVLNHGGIRGGRGLLADLFLVTPGSVVKAFRDHYQTIERTEKENDPIYSVVYLPQVAGSGEISESPRTLVANLYENKYFWLASPFIWMEMAAGFIVDRTSKPLNASKEYLKYGSPAATDTRYRLSQISAQLKTTPDSTELKDEKNQLTQQLKVESDAFFGTSECWKKAQASFKTLCSQLVEARLLTNEERQTLFNGSSVNMLPKKLSLLVTRNTISTVDIAEAIRVMIAHVNYELYLGSNRRPPAALFDKDWILLKSQLARANFDTTPLEDNIVGGCSQDLVQPLK